jgi:hypothetical protein
MTLDELSTMTVDVLTPAQVAPILRLDADTIRRQARDCPERLGFNVIVAGSRVKIPRVAFLRFMRGECTEGEKTQ